MKNHKERAHAILSPSSMHRIVKCLGSVFLSEGIEQPESEYAAEGTLAHEIAEIKAKEKLEKEGFKVHE